MNAELNSVPPSAGGNKPKFSQLERWLTAHAWKYWLGVFITGIALDVALHAMESEFVKRLLHSEFIHGPSGSTPFVIAIGEIIARGISLFSANTAQEASRNTHVVIALSILLDFFVLPTLFLVSLRRYFIIGKEGRQSPEGISTFFGLSLGSIGVIILALTPVTTWVQASVGRSMYAGQSTSGAKDALIFELGRYASEARAMFFVPGNSGGAGGNWNNIPRPGGSFSPLTMSDLKPVVSPHTTIMRGLLPEFHGTYVLDVVNDTCLLITGIGNTDINNSFKNKNGETGKMQISFTFTPNTEFPLKEENL